MDTKGHARRALARATIRLAGVGAMLALATAASAVPATVTAADTAGCDVLSVPAAVDQLGTSPGFPAGEQLAVSATTTTLSACASSTDNVLVANALVSITNLNTVSFSAVWYVANTGTSIGNADGTVNGHPAFRIDALGFNTPLVSESQVADGIFSPGETWAFDIQDYINLLLPASAISSTGVGSGAGSSGSIIALPIRRSTDLGVTKSGPATAVVGGAVDYALTVTNHGPDFSSGADVTDSLPAPVTFASASPSQGSCSFTAPTLTCHLGTIGKDATATVTVHTTANAAGTVTNSASVAPTYPALDADGAAGNDSASATTTISPAGPVYAAQVQQPVNPDGTSTFNARRGSVPVKFALTANGAPTCSLPPATIRVTRLGANGNQPVDEAVYSSPADAGSSFRISSCQYTYNLDAKSMGPGRYQVEVVINGQSVGSATFSLA